MQEQDKRTSGEEIGVAVDLGTTTIAVCCLDRLEKDEILSFSFANPQRQHGADVITRIRYCMESKQNLFEMGQMVREELKTKLKEHLGGRSAAVSLIAYSGNTTMLHILRGLPVEGLASAPFTPADLEYYEENRTGKSITVIQPPGLSAFVGADILAGAVYLQMGNDTTYDLLIDLGTNGELLLLNKDSGFATSTACGPVFDHVITGAKYGSDSIHAIAGCVKRGLIDTTGKIADPFFEKGIVIDKNLIIRQEHVRNFQMAKGAIYAGICCLAKLAGISLTEIGNVYVSGGLGFYLQSNDAFATKLFPKAFQGKIKTSGNTSLKGVRELVLATGNEKAAILKAYDGIRKRTICFELADVDGFQEHYLHAMDFSFGGD